MDPTHRVVGLNPQTNMVFTVVKPVMGILQVSPPQTTTIHHQALQQHPVMLQHSQSPALVHALAPADVQQTPSPALVHALAPAEVQQTQNPSLVHALASAEAQQTQNPALVQALAPAEVQQTQNPALVHSLAPAEVSMPQNPALVHNMAAAEVAPQIHLNQETPEIPNPGQSPGLNQDQTQDLGAGESSVQHLPFAEVSSLLDPNMKGSKARKYLISYDEIRRRLQPPEKMSLRSIAAYTRVSRGPASKRNLQESLSVLGLSPSTTTAVSSSFSKLTEGDTRALCEDMKDFSQDYVDYEAVAKRLIPKTNTVQHWSKIIETKNHLEDVRRCLQEPEHSAAFDSVTHGLGLGMVHVVLDMISSVIQHQIHILSGSAPAAAEPASSSPGSPAQRRGRKRHRHAHRRELASRGPTVLKAKSGGRGRKKSRQDGGQTHGQQQQTGGSNVLLVTVGYEAVSTELNTSEHVSDEVIQD